MSKTFSLQFLQSGTQYIAELESRNSIVAGRSIDCDLNLSEHLQGRVGLISRKHFMITSREEQFFITDLNSQNGTSVNGEKLLPSIPKRIHDGDIINVANSNILKAIIKITKSEYKSNTTSPAVSQDEVDVYILQFDGQDLFIDNKLIPLSLFSPLEEEVLKFLYQKANRACSYHEITQHVWGGSISTYSVRNLINRLQRKMDQISPNSGERFIKTLHGYGYKMTLN